jgi:hypothetical protein
MTLRVTVARRARKLRTAGRHRIKRLPIVQNRANLIQALATLRKKLTAA